MQKKSRGKAQKQVEMSSKLKTHTCDLKNLSRKYATMEIGNGSMECLERRYFREKMNSSQMFEGKLKKI